MTPPPRSPCSSITSAARPGTWSRNAIDALVSWDDRVAEGLGMHDRLDARERHAVAATPSDALPEASAQPG
jgi:hypothetical protein